MVRNAMFRRVELVARDDLDGLVRAGAADADRIDPPREVVMTRSAWDAALEDYYAEHDDARHRRRRPRPVAAPGRARRRRAGRAPDETPYRLWRVRQTLDDPEGHHDWVIEAIVDLDASDEVGERGDGRGDAAAVIARTDTSARENRHLRHAQVCAQVEPCLCRGAGPSAQPINRFPARAWRCSVRLDRGGTGSRVARRLGHKSPSRQTAPTRAAQRRGATMSGSYSGFPGHRGSSAPEMPPLGRPPVPAPPHTTSPGDDHRVSEPTPLSPGSRRPPRRPPGRPSPPPTSCSARPAGRCHIPEPRPGDHPRPRPGDLDVQPEGWRRQDHDHDQPRRLARGVRPQGAARRLRPAGLAVGRPRASTRTRWT